MEHSDLGKTDVLFVNMPFARTVVPSLPMSTFLPLLQRLEYRCELLYSNLDLSARLGRVRYDRIADLSSREGMMLGELLFAQVLHGQDRAKEVTELALEASGRGCARIATELASDLRAFISDTAASIVALQPRVVGFSSIFQQQLSILACAQELRRQNYEGVIIVGGANCEGPMGQQLARSFDTLDFVVSGPGELVLPRLLEVFLRGGQPVPLAGVFPTARRHRWPDAPDVTAPEGPLDDLPIPDFSSYFRAVAQAEHPAPEEALLPFEGSRGCWWGARHHCTFCGLNGATMTMRAKSGERALRELRHQAHHWPGATLMPVDTILPMSYLKELLPALAADPVGRLFYEVKSNLRFDQLELMKRAGLVELQPGIESLSDAALKRMRKGVTALQNVQLLRDCKQLRMNLRWNLLYGFPGEDEQDYQVQLELIPLLSHLQPPRGAGRAELDRFSPMFERPQDFGIEAVWPLPPYSLLYPQLSAEEVGELAYYHDGRFPQREAFGSLRKEVRDAVSRWHQEHPVAFLALVQRGESQVLVDTRPRSSQRFYTLGPVEVAVLEHSRRVAGRQSLLRRLGAMHGERAVEEAVLRLRQLGVLACTGEQVVSLVEEAVELARLEQANNERRLRFG